MTKERMLKLIIMDRISETVHNDEIYRLWFEYHYDKDKFFKEYKELGDEFLKPYTKKFTSKES